MIKHVYITKLWCFYESPKKFILQKKFDTVKCTIKAKKKKRVQMKSLPKISKTSNLMKVQHNKTSFIGEVIRFF